MAINIKYIRNIFLNNFEVYIIALNGNFKKNDDKYAKKCILLINYTKPTLVK